MFKILVIDDDCRVAEGCKGVLRAAGFDAVTSQSGLHGLALARTRQFSVVLADLRLPDISGVEILRKLREEHVNVAFVVMTGFGSAQSAAEAIRLGAADYVEKPLFGDDLVRVVRSAAASSVLPTSGPQPQSGLPHPADSAAARDTRIQEVIRIIESQLSVGISIDQLAAPVGLGPSRLRHLFRDAVGMSLGRYRKERRLDVAAEMLVLTRERISEIGYRVGFSNPAYFDRAFRRRFGLCPREYRTRHQQRPSRSAAVTFQTQERFTGNPRQDG